jgi:serine/threonine protein kinase/tetratricopeptide (TPR) repeat protein
MTTSTTDKPDGDPAAMGDTAPAEDPAAAALRKFSKRMSGLPRLIGRYRVAGRLGEGGMGSVFTAYDPQLDRPVAIKLLRSSRATADATARMLREAKALAALSHPNIVSVFEVGLYEGDCPFIAMELIEGRTLDAYLEDERPDWRRVLEVFDQAGQALVAAHDRGIVHRDFKPTNVLVDDRGRVRVLDFGLASVTERVGTWGDVATDEYIADDTTLELAHDVTESHPVVSTLTETGTLIGTPAYMSPEQYLCSPIEAAADQFSFCVALWEALYRTRPFTGLMMDDVIEQVRRGEFTIHTPLQGVPTRVRRALERGLAFEPRDRFQSFQELLDELARCRSPRRRAPLLVLATVGVTAAMSSWLWGGDAPELSRCEPASTVTADVWSPPRADALTARFGPESESWVRTQGRIDRFADRWAQAYAQACPAGEDQALSDASVCLQHRLGTLDEMLTLLEDASSEDLRSVPFDLPPLAACAEITVGTPPAPPRDELRGAVASMWSRLDRVDALTALGHFDDAAEVAASVRAGAEEIDYGPVVAAAQLRGGRVDVLRSHYPEARQAFLLAYERAMSEGDDRTAMHAALQLMSLHSDALGEHEAALSWYRHAKSAAARMGAELPPSSLVVLGMIHSHLENPDEAMAVLEEAARRLELADEDSASLSPSERMHAKTKLAMAYHATTQYERSIAQYREALALAEEVYGRRSLPWATAAVDLAGVLGEYLAFEESVALLRDAIPILETFHGPEHWAVADARMRLGLALVPQGKLTEAVEIMRQGADLASRLADESNPRVVFAHVNLADALYYAGEYEEADELLGRLQAVLEARDGPEASRTALVIYRRGRVRSQVDSAAAAEPLYQRAVEILEKLPDHHPAEVEARGSLAMALSERGAHDEAQLHARRALRLMADEFGESNRAVAEATWQMQRVFREAGHACEGIDRTERALAVLLDEPTDPGHLAQAKWELARSYAACDQDLHLAAQYAAEAAEVYASDPRIGEEEAEPLRAFASKYERQARSKRKAP